MSIINFFNEVDDTAKKNKRGNKPLLIDNTPKAPRTPADDFHDQVEKFYSLPREQYPRFEVKFSPSGVTKCARELYYMNTGAHQDEQMNITPWKVRLPRNGEGAHIVTQKDYLEMHKKLFKAGIQYQFKMEKTEVTSKKTFDVDGVKVTLSGRCDGILTTENGIQYIWEKKTKDKMKNLKKLKEPQDDHKAQVVCYSLLFKIPRTIFEIESLQKPDWNKDEEEDQKHFYFESTPEMEQALLKRLASIVKMIEAKKLPSPEYDKCMFCSYKTQCRNDGV